jgi:MoaA/NifB/PqqE/SkfB family radical SAM enzyme
VRSFFGGRPVWCAWQATYRCNFRCAFCHYWKERHRASEEQSIAEIRRGAKELAKIGSLMVSIAGGEPLLRKDLPQMVEILARHHFPLITTNGWLTTPDLARTLFEAGLWGISISLDYAAPDRHDHWRGMKGAHERALRALKIFAEARRARWQRVNIMAVLNHENLEDMEPLIQLALEHNAWFMVQPYCAMKTGHWAFRHPRGASGHLLALRRKYPNFLSNPIFLGSFDTAADGGVPGCLAGKAFFNIDNYGRVAQCVEDRAHPVGVLHKDPIETILARLRERHAETQCRTCWYNCRGEIESLYTLKGAVTSLPTLLMTSREANPKRPLPVASHS